MKCVSQPPALCGMLSIRKLFSRPSVKPPVYRWRYCQVQKRRGSSYLGSQRRFFASRAALSRVGYRRRQHGAGLSGTRRCPWRQCQYGRCAFAGASELRPKVAQVLQGLREEALPDDCALIAVGGTNTCLMAMELGLTKYDSRRIHGQTLRKERVDAWCQRLLQLSQAEQGANSRYESQAG